MTDIEKAAGTVVNVTETPLSEDDVLESKNGSRIEKSEKPKSKVDDWYLWEAGGVVLSAICIMTIIGLLIWLDHKKLPHCKSGNVSNVSHC